MAAGVIQCQDGDVAISMDGAPLCSGVWTLVPVPEPFDIESADHASLAAAFFVGFTLVGTFWFAGRCFRALLSIIK